MATSTTAEHRHVAAAQQVVHVERGELSSLPGNQEARHQPLNRLLSML